MKVLGRTFDTLEDYLSYLEQEWHRFLIKLYTLEDYLRMGKTVWDNEHPLICDGCGKQFATTLDENDDPMPLDEEAEETGWTVNVGSAYCGNCQHLDPDQLEAKKWEDQLAPEWSI